MCRFTLAYFVEYFRQTVFVLTMGIIWLMCSVAVGQMLVGNPYEGVGCISPVPHNFQAMIWITQAFAGFWWTSILVVAFGFLANAVTKGRRGVYSVLIFVGPAFALVMLEIGERLMRSSEGYLMILTIYAGFALSLATLFLPGFFCHRHLTKRWSGCS